MAERNKHLFQFQADRISEAAKEEAAYHEEREAHWRERAEKALVEVESTIGAKVVRQPVSGGEQVTIAVDYGDRAAWDEYLLADSKVKSHRAAAERYRTDERVYGSQGVTAYDLDADDVHHFRLGGEPRED